MSENAWPSALKVTSLSEEYGLHFATFRVRPMPRVYSQGTPNNGNRISVRLINVGCDLGDRQGDPLETGAENYTDTEVTL